MVDVELTFDGGAMGTGGTPATNPGPSATQCPLPDWYAQASMLDLKEVACRTPKNDPVVAFAERLYREQKSMLPTAGEGQTPSRCDFNWPSSYYQDPAYPDQYTFCQAWCGILRYAANQVFKDYMTCNTALQMARDMM